jgi:hypothetical protein
MLRADANTGFPANALAFAGVTSKPGGDAKGIRTVELL